MRGKWALWIYLIQKEDKEHGNDSAPASLFAMPNISSPIFD